jgi:hypothetical protein
MWLWASKLPSKNLFGFGTIGAASQRVRPAPSFELAFSKLKALCARLASRLSQDGITARVFTLSIIWPHGITLC